jgi:hypothetical protein
MIRYTGNRRPVRGVRRAAGLRLQVARCKVFGTNSPPPEGLGVGFRVKNKVPGCRYSYSVFSIPVAGRRSPVVVKKNCLN